ncbi:MAG: hypothetical protein JNK05_14885 [Myxococcales bacterium]|nr:hypothetical protein [Myxococcales bacterium]
MVPPSCVEELIERSADVGLRPRAARRYDRAVLLCDRRQVFAAMSAAVVAISVTRAAHAQLRVDGGGADASVARDAGATRTTAPPVGDEPIELQLSIVGSASLADVQRAQLLHAVAQRSGSVTLESVGSLRAIARDPSRVWLHGGRNTVLELGSGAAHTLRSGLWVGALSAVSTGVLLVGVGGPSQGLALFSNGLTARWEQTTTERSSATGTASALTAWAMGAHYDPVHRRTYVSDSSMTTLAEVDVATGQRAAIALPSRAVTTEPASFLSGAAIVGGRVFRVSQTGSDVRLHRLDLATRQWDALPVTIGARLGPYSPCRGLATSLVLRGAVRDDLLAATAYGALVFLRTDGVIVSAVDLQHGVARAGTRLLVAAQRCDGMRVIDAQRPSEAMDVRAELRGSEGFLSEASDDGPALFVEGDCVRRGLGPRIVRIAPDGSRSVERGSCSLQQSSSRPGTVLSNPTVQADGSVLFVVREASGVFVVRARVGPSARRARS